MIKKIILYFVVTVILVLSYIPTDNADSISKAHAVQAMNEQDNLSEDTTEAFRPDDGLLKKTIQKAIGLNAESYTEETFLQLVESIRQAQVVLYKNEASQEEIDKAQIQLQHSMYQLVLTKSRDKIVLIGIGAAGACCVILFLAIIISKRNNMNRNKKQKEGKKPSKKSLDVGNRENESVYNEHPQYQEKEIPDGNAEQRIEDSLKESQSDEPGLNFNNDDIVDVMQETPKAQKDPYNLTCSMRDQFKLPRKKIAYLLNQNTGEHIQIDTVEFTVGRDETNVNYCVKCSEMVSKLHMEIIERGRKYYLKDLNSASGTRLNGQQLVPLKEAELQDGDEVTIADVNFTLEIRDSI